MGKLVRVRDPGTWRRIALQVWNEPNDPHIYGTMAVDATRALALLDRLRAETGEKVTMTHLAGKALAHALRELPDCNARIRRRRVYQRTSVDLFFQVVFDDGKELSGAKIERVDGKKLVEVARELREKAERIRMRQDPQFNATKRLLDRAPGFLVRFVMWLLAFLTEDLGLDLRRFGVPRDPFGSAMVTSVGMFGIEIGYAPLFPPAEVPIIALVGAVEDRPKAEGGQVVVRPMLNVSATFDHRLIDGAHGGRLASLVKRYLEDPPADA